MSGEVIHGHKCIRGATRLNILFFAERAEHFFGLLVG